MLAVLTLALGAGAAPPAAEAATTSQLTADCRDGVIHGSYSERLMRRVQATGPGDPCAAALSAEIAAVSMSEDIVGDCFDDGELGGRYTREELSRAERDLPSDVDEYSNCREVIARARRRVPSADALARSARQARRPLTAAKARRYAQRLGDRVARRRARVKYATRVGVRTIRLQAHYERLRGDEVVRCFAEIVVTRAYRTGGVTARRTRKVCTAT